jgi:hypothetical protein
VEWSLDGPLPKLCPVIPASNQDGHQAKNRKKGDEMLIVRKSSHGLWPGELTRFMEFMPKKAVHKLA